MSYPENKQDAARLAEDVIARMAEHDIPANPENYTVWYSYLSGRDPDLCHMIDRILDSKAPFTDEQCSALYLRCTAFAANEIGDERDAALVSVSADMERSVETVMALLEEAGADAARYGETLADVDGVLRSEDAAGQVRKVVSDLVSETQRIVAQNRNVNSRLEKSNQEIVNLKERIAEVRNEAMCDPLTGLQNRRAFDEKLRQSLVDTQADHSPMSLLLFDIDHFKSFNDTHGHQLGDEVLRLVAGCLVECTKGRDTATRYGGEEFAIILPETDIEGALAVAEQVRETVAGKRIIRKSSGESLGSVTLSGGAAQYIEGETLEHLIERADGALYAAKKTGRNRIEAADEQVGLRVVAGNDVA